MFRLLRACAITFFLVIFIVPSAFCQSGPEETIKMYITGIYAGDYSIKRLLHINVQPEIWPAVESSITQIRDSYGPDLGKIKVDASGLKTSSSEYKTGRYMVNVTGSVSVSAPSGKQIYDVNTSYQVVRDEGRFLICNPSVCD